eukprot:2112444-Amphidinium_carterae.1
MDKASASGAGDSGFKSQATQIVVFEARGESVWGLNPRPVAHKTAALTKRTVVKRANKGRELCCRMARWKICKK